MYSELSKKAKKHIDRSRRKGLWHRLVRVLACIVVFCTTYAMILPVITQEQECFCGYEAHSHSEDCYDESSASQAVLSCSYASLNVHAHASDCFDAEGRVRCGQADYLLHSHSAICFDADGALYCALPEKGAHVHADSCYIQHTGHTHSEGCFAYQRGELVCTQPESVSHFHDTSCWGRGEEAICGMQENHAHEGACYASLQELVCGMEEHAHGGDCYASELACADEAHEHDDACYVSSLSCSQQEHTHDDGCQAEPVLVCAEEESHVHSDACYDRILVCGLEEGEGHAHADECYAQISVLECASEESSAYEELVCTEAEAQAHVHSDACFEGETQGSLICTLEEHEHSLICYSNPNADHETREEWERSFADVELSGIWAEDVLAIARTQLGYRESIRNYIVLEDGENIKGYTRYGDWYDADYSDWCGMFASFCIFYADVEGMPLEAGCEEWIHKLEAVGLFGDPDDYEPVPGDLVFFDCDEDGESDHVGIIEKADDELKTIEGNFGNKVCRVNCADENRKILGYGILPVNPDTKKDEIHDDESGETIYDQPDQEMDDAPVDPVIPVGGGLICADPEHAHDDSCYEVRAYLCGMSEHSHDIFCFDESGACICTAAEHCHDDSCLSSPEDVLPEEDVPVEEEAVKEDSSGNRTLICIDPEHEHDGGCYEVQAYLCGMNEHVHDDSCFDESSAVVCVEEEHEHSEECLSASEDETIEDTEEDAEEEIEEKDEESENCTLICADPEHEHDDSCYEVRAYLCGMNVHAHVETCFDESGVCICIETEHSHTEGCLVEVLPVEPVYYYCGLTEHIHEDACFDESGLVICIMGEHIHSEECLVEILPEEPVYYCGMNEHIHDDACFDESDICICSIEEHTHNESCLIAIVYNCGMEEHRHGESCHDENGMCICPIDEHSHNESCLDGSGWFCGAVDHAHILECMDEAGWYICGMEEHNHNLACTVDVRSLNDDLRRQVREIILLIEELPSYDEIEIRIIEYEAYGDYAGEEAWLTELYRQVKDCYRNYSLLPMEAQELVVNRDALLELEFIWAQATLDIQVVGQTIGYSSNMFAEDNALFVVYTQGTNDKYYAFDGNGNAVEIQIDANGTITADVGSKYDLLWNFTSKSGNSYLIQNAVEKGRYMHAYSNNGTGVTTSGAWESTLISSGNGVRIRSNSTDYARLNQTNNPSSFVRTGTQSDAAVFQFGVVYEHYLWLDGTDGGLMSLGGSPNEKYPVSVGDTFVLPDTWESPEKYSYSLRGWYDVSNKKYYTPGSTVEVTGNMVFYADWVAASYNIGQFNSLVADTQSTSSFITTHVFDYNSMFNLMSADATVTVNSSGHTETWRMNGSDPGFIFRDWDSGGDISYPNNYGHNTSQGTVTTGLYSAELKKLLFSTSNSFDPENENSVLGKQYIGKGDHLFQYGDDPSEKEHYGYYYYDSAYNAASYNRSAGRFYVYDYLEATTDSNKSDFLPLNSPDVNTNGKTVRTYSYAGENGEYSGTTHYLYDAKYNTENNSTNNVAVNYWFGMSTEIEFYLPNKPGSTDDEGNFANTSLYGDELLFEFSGDDDVWVLVDNELVLDIGGIHGVKSGSINFSTGEVMVDGSAKKSVTYLEPGTHKLTMYYLERGSSQSNCKIRFNLSPRYNLSLQKEDVLTRHMLNGAQFSVYTDAACSKPAELWTSRTAFENGQKETNTFTVTNGKADMWGFSAGNTYYIKETKAPEGYDETKGIIVMSLNNRGVATYKVIEDENSQLTGGFTVHGYKVDFEEQEAYLVVTNGQNVDEVTNIIARKTWSDGLAHEGESITVYLVANGQRIREETLSSANNWQFIWENMPVNDPEGNPVVYEVQEGTVSGYISRVEQVENFNTTTLVWEERSTFESGKIYLLKSGNNYLSAGNNNISWVTDESTAQASPNTRWTVEVNNSTYYLTNEAGQKLYFYSSYSWNGIQRNFRASSSNQSNMGLGFNNGRLSFNSSGTTYYASSLSNGSLNATSSKNSATTFTLLTPVETTVIEPLPVEGIGFKITNTPIGEEETVSLTVTKVWDPRSLGDTTNYEELTVDVRLLSNGKDTGLTADLGLKNSWMHTFSNLPKYDSANALIEYSVEEIWTAPEWRPEYGEVTQVDSNGNVFSTTITNISTLIYMLPETGGTGTLPYTAGGLMLIAASIILLLYNHRRDRRREGR